MAGKNKTESTFLLDAKKFRTANLDNWEKISDFWLKHNFKHEIELEKCIINIVNRYKEQHNVNRPQIIDIGCGNAWVYELLQKSGDESDYIGIDFNERFINYLEKKYVDDPKFKSQLIDIESMSLPENLQCKFDLALNLFNFFELPALERAFENVLSLLKPGGWLVIGTIDITTQLLTVSKTKNAFYDNLLRYQSNRSNLAYAKSIRLNNRRTSNFYYGISYSLEDFFRLIVKYKLKIIEYNELISSDITEPQIFQIIALQK